MRNMPIMRCLAPLLVLTGSLYLLDLPGLAAPPQTPLPAHPQKRLLVIAPHPDDESLAGVALIQKTLREGGIVQIAVMTNGDGFRRAAAKRFRVSHPQASDLYRLGLVRQAEELDAIKRIGLQEQQVLFLGYPDAGLRHLWSTHWSRQTPYAGLNGYRQVPYPRSYSKGSPYSGQAVTDDLRRILTEFHPTDLLYPDPHDVHGDHWATSAFTQYALAGLPIQPNEWTYLIHYPQFPKPRRYRPYRSLRPPDRLQDVGIRWHHLPLQNEEIEQKRSAIFAHRSQVDVMKNLLSSFIRKNDLIGDSTIPELLDVGKQVELVDPMGDQSGEDAVDIRKVTFARTAEQLRIRIDLTRAITAQHRFTVRLRLPDAEAEDPSQIEVKFEHQKLSLSNYPELKGQIDQSITWHSHHNQLLLQIPIYPFQKNHSLLTETEVNLGKSVDRTAWQRLYL
ncbi:PIG-L deacetylase family protein [Tumebacillus algifaecis]|nr:PIG-L family deacetylase [Tumebacillus algifaecis]